MVLELPEIGSNAEAYLDSRRSAHPLVALMAARKPRAKDQGLALAESLPDEMFLRP